MTAAWAGAAITTVLLVVTLRWKISLHTAITAAFVVLAVVAAGPGALWLAALVPLVAWSRLHLGRHDLPQTIAGTFVGGGMTVLAFWLL